MMRKGPRYYSRADAMLGADLRIPIVKRSSNKKTMKATRSLAAVLAFLPLLPTSALAAGSTKIIMVAGDHAPDGNGVFSSTLLTAGGLNDAGQAVFAAQLVGTANGSADNSGLFRGDGSTLVQIARAGQSFGPSGVFSGADGFQGNSALNQGGQVAFSAFLSVTDGGGITGIFRGSGTPESLTQIVRQGQAVPSGNGMFGTVYGSSVPLTLNDAGQVAFYTRIDNATRSQSMGLFRGDGTAITPIAVVKSPISGATNFGTLTAGPVLNRTGKVAFATSLIITNTIASASAVAVSDGTNPSLYARTGQATPDGNGTFNDSLAPFINESGQVAFVSSVQGIADSYHALYFGSGATLTEIARTGQAAPGIAGENLGQFEWVYLNNPGQVAFTAITCCTPAIYRWSPTTGTITNLVRKEQAAPDGNGVIDLLHGSEDSPVELNDQGQIAFASFVVGGSLFNDSGIFFYDDRLGLLQVARIGDPLLGSSVKTLALATGASRANIAGAAAGRPFSPLNNHGQVAYSFVLTDGRAGVAVWTPPPAMSELRITDVALAGKDVHLSWIAPAGTTNVVQASTNVSSPFNDVSAKISSAGVGQLTNRFIELGGATNQPARFYRVRQVP
jgi:hypothetical protein